jgi:galactokinase
VVSENARTTQAAAALRSQRYEQAGELMVASHRSLRDDYQVSIPQLDFLAAEAMKVKGVYGARMSGGGFGGCIVALSQPRSVEALREHLASTYLAQFKIAPDMFITTAGEAAGVIE